MPDNAISILVSAGIAFAIAFGSVVVARRAGISDIDAVVREQRGALVSTLKTRVEHLEAENERLHKDIEYLKRENEQLRTEVARLQRHIIERDLETGNGRS